MFTVLFFVIQKLLEEGCGRISFEKFPRKKRKYY